MKEESGNINGARVFKNLDIRLRYFGLFLGNRESAEVANQRSGTANYYPWKIPFIGVCCDDEVM